MKKQRLYYEVIQHNRRLFDGKVKPYYFTRLHNRGRANRKDFVRICKRLYGTKPEDCYRVLNDATATLLNLLLAGFTVDVPYLGTFKLVSNGTCSEDRKKAGAKAVKTIKAQYSPLAEFKAYYNRGNVIMIEWPKSKQEGKCS